MNILEPINQTKLYGLGSYFNELARFYKNGNYPNKIIFCGQKDIGKSTLAFHFISYVLTTNDKYKYDTDDFNINIEDPIKLPNDILFLHYAGSFKPWTVRGALEKNSIYYMNTYRKHSDKKFHITHTWKYSSLLHLIKGFINLKIINTRHPFSFFKEVIKSFLN